MHNPGTILHDNRFYAGADLICVFESPYADYANASHPLDKLPSEDINGYKRENFAYMISGLPTNWTNTQLHGFVDQVKPGAQYLFMTDINIQEQDIYASFGSSWDEFVGEISLSPATSLTTSMHK